MAHVPKAVVTEQGGEISASIAETNRIRAELGLAPLKLTKEQAAAAKEPSPEAGGEVGWADRLGSSRNPVQVTDLKTGAEEDDDLDLDAYVNGGAKKGAEGEGEEGEEEGPTVVGHDPRVKPDDSKGAAGGGGSGQVLDAEVAQEAARMEAERLEWLESQQKGRGLASKALHRRQARGKATGALARYVDDDDDDAADEDSAGEGGALRSTSLAGKKRFRANDDFLTHEEDKQTAAGARRQKKIEKERKREEKRRRKQEKKEKKKAKKMSSRRHRGAAESDEEDDGGELIEGVAAAMAKRRAGASESTLALLADLEAGGAGEEELEGGGRGQGRQSGLRDQQMRQDEVAEASARRARFQEAVSRASERTGGRQPDPKKELLRRGGAGAVVGRRSFGRGRVYRLKKKQGAVEEEEEEEEEEGLARRLVKLERQRPSRRHEDEDEAMAGPDRGQRAMEDDKEEEDEEVAARRVRERLQRLQQQKQAEASAGASSRGMVFSSVATFSQQMDSQNGAERDGKAGGAAAAGSAGAAAGAAKTPEEGGDLHEELAQLRATAASSGGADQEWALGPTAAQATRAAAEDEEEAAAPDAEWKSVGQTAALGERKTAVGGMAAALAHLSRSGHLAKQDVRQRNKEENWSGRANDERPTWLGTEDDPAPHIKLEHRDEFGRLMTYKQAYRELSYQFHGRRPGKRKTEKRLREFQQQQEQQRAAAKGGEMMGRLVKDAQKRGMAFTEVPDV